MVGTNRLAGGIGRAAVACGVGLSLAVGGLAAAAPAFAASASSAEANNTGNTGSTEVTVMTADTLADIPSSEDYDIDEGDLLAFEVPTVIPFVALADGTLVGPSADVTRITNLSEFGIHVVEASVEFEQEWYGVADAQMVLYENAIDFQFGPEGAMTDAATAGDDDVSACTEYNMTYAGSDGDSVGIETAGNVNNVAENLVAGETTKVATITWTISAGNAVDADDEDETDDEEDAADEDADDADEDAAETDEDVEDAEDEDEEAADEDAEDAEEDSAETDEDAEDAEDEDEEAADEDADTDEADA